MPPGPGQDRLVEVGSVPVDTAGAPGKAGQWGLHLQFIIIATNQLNRILPQEPGSLWCQCWAWQRAWGHLHRYNKGTNYWNIKILKTLFIFTYVQ